MNAPIEIKVGSQVRPDGWSSYGKLNPGLDGFCSYYLTTNSDGPIKELAVRVEVTGRTTRRDRGLWAYRARIIFVGDGSPDQTVGGWTPAYPW